MQLWLIEYYITQLLIFKNNSFNKNNYILAEYAIFLKWKLINIKNKTLF